MTGMTFARAWCVGAFALLLLAGACKKNKEPTTPKELQDPPPPSGSMSLQGMYSYMADASSFLDCATRERWPVAMEGDNIALERAYRQAKSAPGAPLLVTVQGRLESRPKMDGRGKETNLIVDRFIRTWPRETCGSMTKANLENTRWELLELDGKTITVTVKDKAPYLELNPEKASAYGFGGCNRFFGSYETTDRTLQFSTMGATRMACPEGMDQEQAFFRALDSVRRYEVHGSKLLLYSDAGLVARFEARDQPDDATQDPARTP